MDLERALLKAVVTAAGIFFVYHAGQSLKDYALVRAEKAQEKEIKAPVKEKKQTPQNP